MRVHIEKYQSGMFKEPRALYIYQDHKFKSFRIVRPNMQKFNGGDMDWKNLALAIEPNYYKYEVK